MKLPILTACGLTCLMAAAAVQADSAVLEQQSARLHQGGPTTMVPTPGNTQAEPAAAYWEQRSARLQRSLSPRPSQRMLRRPLRETDPWWR